MANKVAIVTGASTGIGLELAKLAAADGYDLLVVADTPMVDATSALQGSGVDVQSIEADLSTFEGVDRLLAAASSRPVDALFANAGHGPSAARSSNSGLPTGATSSTPTSRARSTLSRKWRRTWSCATRDAS